MQVAGWSRAPAVATTIVALAGCAGGGEGGPLSPDTVRFAARVLDASGAAMPGATVVVQTPKGAYSASAGSDGRYSLDVPAGLLAGIDPVALNVYKSGYKPATYYYRVSGGTSYTVEGGARLGTLAANQFVPQRGWGLTHIGDDNFGGSINSQLQAPATGTSFADTFPASFLSTHSTVVVTAEFRGAQSACGSTMWLYQFVGGQPVGLQQLPLQDSPADGSFGIARYAFALGGYSAANGPVYVGVVSGATGLCTGGDHDDLEFTGLYVDFAGTASGTGGTGSGTGAGSGAPAITGVSRTVSRRADQTGRYYWVDYELDAALFAGMSETDRDRFVQSVAQYTTVVLATPTFAPESLRPYRALQAVGPGGVVLQDCPGDLSMWSTYLGSIDTAHARYASLDTTGVIGWVYDSDDPTVRWRWDGARRPDWAQIRSWANGNFTAWRQSSGC